MNFIDIELIEDVQRSKWAFNFESSNIENLKLCRWERLLFLCCYSHTVSRTGRRVLNIDAVESSYELIVEEAEVVLEVRLEVEDEEGVASGWLATEENREEESTMTRWLLNEVWEQDLEEKPNYVCRLLGRRKRCFSESHRTARSRGRGLLSLWLSTCFLFSSLLPSKTFFRSSGLKQAACRHSSSFSFCCLFVLFSFQPMVNHSRLLLLLHLRLQTSLLPLLLPPSLPLRPPTLQMLHPHPLKVPWLKSSRATHKQQQVFLSLRPLQAFISLSRVLDVRTESKWEIYAATWVNVTPINKFKALWGSTNDHHPDSWLLFMQGDVVNGKCLALRPGDQKIVFVNETVTRVADRSDQWV